MCLLAHNNLLPSRELLLSVVLCSRSHNDGRGSSRQDSKLKGTCLPSVILCFSLPQRRGLSEKPSLPPPAECFRFPVFRSTDPPASDTWLHTLNVLKKWQVKIYEKHRFREIMKSFKYCCSRDLAFAVWKMIYIYLHI